MEKQLIRQGAEARVFETEYFGRPAILKERFSKDYRHPILDAKLTERRLTQEVRCITRCRKAGLNVPAVYYVDPRTHSICMEKIDGFTVKDLLLGGLEKSTAIEYCKNLGHTLALMHEKDVIHGDLTTSNMIVRQSTNAVTLIDFGLSYVSNMAEDKAVDLYVLQKAMLSTHANSEDLFDAIVQEYSKSSKQAAETLNRLEQVKQRGRKRSMLG